MYVLQTKTDTDDKPMKNVVVTECGEIPVSKPFEISDEFYG